MRGFLHRDPLADAETLIRQVYAYAAYRLGHGPDAEDVTSEVFERALRYRRSFDRSKGSPVAWLLGIARRCADDLLARPREYHEPVETSDGRDLEEETVRRMMLAGALAQLSDRDRELIALRYGGDLTAAQIAELLGAQTNAIEVALHRALARLRRLLESQEAATLRPTGSGRL
ncbi:MAG TPA: sigma-70 family RNA polymerase sigma factor [Gaiellaceae bacterium]|nr:sigma-70 family RNA polymerase sigma factor [Gaiellaceae bacterium]